MFGFTMRQAQELLLTLSEVVFINDFIYLLCHIFLMCIVVYSFLTCIAVGVLVYGICSSRNL